MCISTNDLPGHVHEWLESACVLVTGQAMHTLVTHQAMCTFSFAAGATLAKPLFNSVRGNNACGV